MKVGQSPGSEKGRGEGRRDRDDDAGSYHSPDDALLTADDVLGGCGNTFRYPTISSPEFIDPEDYDSGGEGGDDKTIVIIKDELPASARSGPSDLDSSSERPQFHNVADVNLPTVQARRADPQRVHLAAQVAARLQGAAIQGAAMPGAAMQ
eukprot:1616425-Rhodomonas_salina.1